MLPPGYEEYEWQFKGPSRITQLFYGSMFLLVGAVLIVTLLAALILVISGRMPITPP